MDIKESQFCWASWREQQSESKYLHFDKPTSLMYKKTWNFVTNPGRVAKHPFYPFIYFTIENKKIFYNKIDKKLKTKKKKRPICYSAHKDRCIFKYYGKKLNLDYEVFLAKGKLGENVLAYRSGMPSHFNNNIYFAKKAFESISEYNNCYIIIGDFENFFDRLDHTYLKERLCSILSCKSNCLKPDWFAVFNAITQYKIITAADIAELKGCKNFFEYQKLIRTNRENVLFDIKQFRFYKTLLIQDIAQLNPDLYGEVPTKRVMGIPQGSAMSGVLSNVYMSKFDEEMRDLAQSSKGLYMRYSDDFILVVPSLIDHTISEIWNGVYDIVKSIPQLKLSKEKVAFYKYSEKAHSNRISKINNLGNKDTTNIQSLDYLGFSFDGLKVKLRDRTIFRYFAKVKKSTKHQYRRVENKLSPNYCSMYKRFTSNPNRQHNKEDKEFQRFNRNFITYSKKAERIFGKQINISAKIRKPLTQIRKIRKKIARQYS